MSILFQGRPQGAQSSKVSAVQKFYMFFVGHIRQALGSLGDLWRAKVPAMMTIGVLGLSITLPGTLYILVKNAENVSAGWEQASEISLFLRKGTTQPQVDQLLTRLKVWPEINTIRHVPADSALEEFKLLSGFGEALQYLDENPLPEVILIAPTQKHTGPTAARILLDKLRKERLVEVGKLDIEWLERLHAFLDIAKELVTIIALLLFLAVVLIIGNTIRLNILNKRDEILVMKLVGATDGFIHRPFLYTGFWYGFLGGLIAWFSVSLLLWWMESSIRDISELYQKDFHITGLSLTAVIMMLTISVGLGLLGSLISVQRHVKEIEPK